MNLWPLAWALYRAGRRKIREFVSGGTETEGVLSYTHTLNINLLPAPLQVSLAHPTRFVAFDTIWPRDGFQPLSPNQKLV